MRTCLKKGDIVYKLIIEKVAGGECATIKKNGKFIECADGLYVDSQDKVDLQELVSLANQAAQQSVQLANTYNEQEVGLTPHTPRPADTEALIEEITRRAINLAQYSTVDHDNFRRFLRERLGGAKLCPECGSEVVVCMMGHYCGEVRPRKERKPLGALWK